MAAYWHRAQQHVIDHRSRRVYEVLGKQLNDGGVDVVFAFPSNDVVKLVAVLEQYGVRVLLSRHEHVAVGMADGYSRAADRPGVAIIGRGPGLTNALNSLATAARACRSAGGVLLLCGDDPEGVHSARTGHAAALLKSVDQPGILKALGVRHVTVGPKSRALRQLRQCLADARDQVVVATIPANILDDAVADFDTAEREAIKKTDTTPTPVGNEIPQKAQLLEMINSAHRPLILAGRGAVHARDQLVELGDTIGALFCTTLRARSLFAQSPSNLGLAGAYATPTAYEYIGNSDLVLAFGASLNEFTTHGGSLFRSARVVHFDADPAAIGRYLPVALGVISDARVAALELTKTLRQNGHHAKGYRSTQVLDAIVASRDNRTWTDISIDGALDPRSLFSEIDRVLPANRVVIVDAGVHSFNAITYLSVPAPDGFEWAVDYGAIGCGLGLAIGAAVARPDRVTVLSVGDGGFMMNLGDLDTAVRYRVPLVVLVSDDGALGSEVLVLRANGLPEATTRYDNPDLAAVARSLGAQAITISALTDVERLGHCVQHLNGPLVVDCKVTTIRDSRLG